MNRVIRVIIETPLLSPCQSCVYWNSIRELLERKYGDAAKHVDRAFPRMLFDGSVRPALLPGTVYGALKRALFVPGAPPPAAIPPIRGIFFDENDVSLYTFSIRLPNGKQTLVNTELATSGAEGVLVVEGDLLEALEKAVRKARLSNVRERIAEAISKGEIELSIGWKRAKGYGRVKVLLR